MSISPDLGQPPYVLFTGIIQNAGHIPPAELVMRIFASNLPYVCEYTETIFPE
jgi:hypothetical protein